MQVLGGDTVKGVGGRGAVDMRDVILYKYV